MSREEQFEILAREHDRVEEEWVQMVANLLLRCLEAVALEEINQESRMARVKVVLSIPMTLPVPEGWEGSDAQYLQRVLEGSPYNVGIRWGAIASELVQAGANVSEVKFELPRG